MRRAVNNRQEILKVGSQPKNLFKLWERFHLGLPSRSPWNSTFFLRHYLDSLLAQCSSRCYSKASWPYETLLFELGKGKCQEKLWSPALTAGEAENCLVEVLDELLRPRPIAVKCGASSIWLGCDIIALLRRHDASSFPPLLIAMPHPCASMMWLADSKIGNNVSLKNRQDKKCIWLVDRIQAWWNKNFLQSISTKWRKWWRSSACPSSGSFEKLPSLVTLNGVTNCLRDLRAMLQLMSRKSLLWASDNRTKLYLKLQRSELDRSRS